MGFKLGVQHVVWFLEKPDLKIFLSKGGFEVVRKGFISGQLQLSKVQDRSVIEVEGDFPYHSGGQGNRANGCNVLRPHLGGCQDHESEEYELYVHLKWYSFSFLFPAGQEFLFSGFFVPDVRFLLFLQGIVLVPVNFPFLMEIFLQVFESIVQEPVP